MEVGKEKFLLGGAWDRWPVPWVLLVPSQLLQRPQQGVQAGDV